MSPHTLLFTKPAPVSRKTLLRSPLAVSIACLLLSGCFAPKYTAAEQEMAETLTGENYQPATREFRDNIETQDVLAQAAFWSREHSLNPGDLEAAIKLASAVRRMGNASQAIEITQQTRALYPRDPYLAAEYAAALIASERGVDAIDTLDTAIRTAPGYARLWSLKGAALDQMEQYELARKHYAKALQITPYDPSILANIGLSYALSGDAATGENWLRRAVEIPGAGPSVRQNLAIVLQIQGKDTEADRFLPMRRSAELTPPPRRPQSQYRTQTDARYSKPSAPLNAPRYPQGYSQSGPNGYQSNSRSTPIQPKANTAPPNNRAPRIYGAEQSAPSSASAKSYAPQAYAPRISTPPVRAPQAQYSQSAPQYKSASEAARAAARNIQAKGKTGRYIEPVSAPTSEQQSILARLSQSLGPRPSGMTPNQTPQAYSKNTQTQNPYAQPQQQQQYQAQQQAPYYAQPMQQSQGYQQNVQQQDQQPVSRGAARRR